MVLGVFLGEDREEKRLSIAFLLSRVLSIPFWAMLSTLTVLLYKEFHISPFLITFLIAMKPATALFATYWSCLFPSSREHLARNLVIANLLRFLPFLLFFFWAPPGWIIFSFCLYMTLSRASVPAWMEMFKRHVSQNSRSSLLSFGNTVEYLGTTVFPILIGMALDVRADSWRILFPITAVLGLLSTVFLLFLPSSLRAQIPENSPRKSLLLPWRQSWEILTTRPDFRRYQIGFMLGGAGLMIVQPVLPYFFVDLLSLSYTEMLFAISVCKGIGFALASPFWSSFFKKQTLFVFSGLVALLAAFFPFLLMGAQLNIWLVYIAYILYGMMQSGSELSWHMSGVVFSNQGESQPFSETNILAVGIRGCIIPFLGSLLFLSGSSVLVMIVGSIFCLVGSQFLLTYRPQKQTV